MNMAQTLFENTYIQHTHTPRLPHLITFIHVDRLQISLTEKLCLLPKRERDRKSHVHTKEFTDDEFHSHNLGTFLRTDGVSERHLRRVTRVLLSNLSQAAQFDDVNFAGNVRATTNRAAVCSHDISVRLRKWNQILKMEEERRKKGEKEEEERM